MSESETITVRAWGGSGFQVGDTLTIAGVYVRPPLWKRVLIALRLMKRPPKELQPFRVGAVVTS